MVTSMVSAGNVVSGPIFAVIMDILSRRYRYIEMSSWCLGYRKRLSNVCHSSITLDKQKVLAPNVVLNGVIELSCSAVAIWCEMMYP